MALYYVGDSTGEVETKLNINYSDFERVTNMISYKYFENKPGKDEIDIADLYRETYPTLQITICQVFPCIKCLNHLLGRRDWLPEIVENWEDSLWVSVNAGYQTTWMWKALTLVKNVPSSQNSRHARASTNEGRSRTAEIHNDNDQIQRFRLGIWMAAAYRKDRERRHGM